MTTKQLDRSKPYGTVVGAANGATFYQDGCEFRADGTPCSEPSVPAEPVEEAPAEEVEVAEAEEDVRAELEAMHPSKIKKLVEMRGLEPVTGAGAKAKNIELLLANDSE
jgi:hypothetical protein